MSDVLTKNLVSRYEARDLLGHGGMGTVIKAYDHTLNREVAIKQLSAGLQQNEAAVEIFLTEAQSLASLAHLNLVNVYDIIEAPEGVAMIQEFVHGTTLEKEVETRGALPEDEVLLVAIQLICVVGYLHHMNYLHRDLKPANIILQPDGYLRLVDFGLSRKFDQLLSRGTEVRGTPAYMAPEQIKSRELKPATDIYQIGVTLYEMLTGQLPFQTNGDTYALAYAHVNEKPPRVQEIRPDISKALSDVVYKCLKKKPKNRYHDCQQLLDAIAPIYQSLCGHSIEESGYMVPFGAVGEGDVAGEDGSLTPNTSGRYLAVPKNTSNNLSTDSLRISDVHAVSLEDDSTVSAQEFEQMEERLEQMEQEHRKKNRRLVTAVGILIVLVGMLAVVAVIISQSGAEDGSMTTPEIAAQTSTSLGEEALPQGTSQAEPAAQKEDGTEPVKSAPEPDTAPPTQDAPEAPPAEPSQPVVQPVTSPPPVKKSAPAKKRVVRKRKKAAPKPAPDTQSAPAEAQPKKSPASYLDGFQKVGADDKKLDDDLKALSEDL